MRGRLLEATVDCLYELGYARTTTIEVAARAGVSRGAQLHHFSTKERLVEVALRHLFDKRTEEFREAFAAVPSGADRLSSAIDILWDKLSNRAFYAWLELVVAARTDEALRPAMTELAARFTEQVHAIVEEFFAPRPGASPAHGPRPLLTFAVLQGLALDRVIWGAGDPRVDGVLDMLKKTLSAGTAAVVNGPDTHALPDYPEGA
ncbi:MAG TPA: TetR/AcrR family transcriptional regulator [Polyangiaceae bacterium]|nr:TetR/AcrR family transcriptional regulator [Polyangiaceae bacterium]